MPGAPQGRLLGSGTNFFKKIVHTCGTYFSLPFFFSFLHKILDWSLLASFIAVFTCKFQTSVRVDMLAAPPREGLGDDLLEIFKFHCRSGRDSDVEVVGPEGPGPSAGFSMTNWQTCFVGSGMGAMGV